MDADLESLSDALRKIGIWTSRFGLDVYYASSEASCVDKISEAYSPSKAAESGRFGSGASPAIVSIDWTKQLDDFVRTIGNSMNWHRTAVKAIRTAAEHLAGNTYSENLVFDYIDVHRLESSLTSGEESTIEASSDETARPNLTEITADAATNETTRSVPTTFNGNRKSRAGHQLIFPEK